MKKKALSFLLALCMVFSLIPGLTVAASAAGAAPTPIAAGTDAIKDYAANNDGTYDYVYYGGMKWRVLDTEHQVYTDDTYTETAEGMFLLSEYALKESLPVEGSLIATGNYTDTDARKFLTGKDNYPVIRAVTGTKNNSLLGKNYARAYYQFAYVKKGPFTTGDEAEPDRQYFVGNDTDGYTECKELIAFEPGVSYYAFEKAKATGYTIHTHNTGTDDFDPNEVYYLLDGGKYSEAGAIAGYAAGTDYYTFEAKAGSNVAYGIDNKGAIGVSQDDDNGGRNAFYYAVSPLVVNGKSVILNGEAAATEGYNFVSRYGISDTEEAAAISVYADNYRDPSVKELGWKSGTSTIDGNRGKLVGDKYYFLHISEFADSGYGLLIAENGKCRRTDDGVTPVGDTVAYSLRSSTLLNNQEYAYLNKINKSGSPSVSYNFQTTAYRPAFNLLPSAVLFVSDAEKGKALSSVGAEASALAGADTAQWKLTLKDDSLSVAFDSLKYYEGESKPYILKYSDASICGDDVFVSLLITDKAGEKLYGYQKLAAVAANEEKSGRAQFALPDWYNSEEHALQFFLEKVNEEKTFGICSKTDYATGPVVLTPAEGEENFKVLLIGNSFTDDAKAFLGTLLQSYPFLEDEDVVLANLSHGGRTVAFYANCAKAINGVTESNSEGMFVPTAYDNNKFDTSYYNNTNSGSSKTWADPAENSLSYSEWNAGAWKRNSSYDKLNDALLKEEWDAVVVQGFGPDFSDNNLSENLTYLTNFIHKYSPSSDVGFYFPWIGMNSGGPGDLSNTWEKTKAAVNAAGIDFLVPIGTTIENLRYTYLADLNYVNEENNVNLVGTIKGLQRDGIHLSSVVGRHAAGITMLDSLVKDLYPAQLENRILLKSITDENLEEIGQLPGEYVDMIYAAADAAVSSPYELTDLSAAPYNFPTEDPAETARVMLDGAVVSVDAAAAVSEIEEDLNTVLAGGKLRNELGIRTLAEGLRLTVKNIDTVYCVTDSFGSYTATVAIQYGYTFKEAVISGTWGDNHAKYVPAGTTIVSGDPATFNGTLVDGSAEKTLFLEYIAPVNVTEELNEQAEEQLPLTADAQYLDTMEVNLYVKDGGALIPVENVVLSDNITVKVPYEGAVVGESYTLYHWNGTGFDGPITATVELIESVPYLVFEYNQFSPFVIIGGVGYNTISATTGEGYTVIYDATAVNGEDYTFSVSVDEGYTLQSVKANGHAFAKDGTDFVDNEDGTYTIVALDDNYTIEVKVSKDAPDTFEVLFNSNGADQTVQDLPEVVKDSYITLPGAVSKDGYTFHGWKNGSDHKVYAAGSLYKVTYNVTFVANLTQDPIPAVYNVTFVTTGANETVQDLTGVAKDTYITLPAGLTKEGAIFDGWTNGGKLYAAGSTYKVTGSVSFTAAFTDAEVPETKTVTFSAAGADQTVQDLTVEKDSIITLPAGLTKENASFIGWVASDVTYAAGSQYKVTDNVTFKAKFEDAVTFDVTFDANGADQSVADMSNVAEDSFIILPGALTKDGYTFIGWKADGVVYAAGSAFKVTEDVEFTAEFQEIVPVTYAVTYVANGGAGDVPEDNTDYEPNDEVTVLANTLTRDGYTFAGWKFNGSIYYEGDTFIINSNVTLKAQWTKNNPDPETYSVIYDIDGVTDDLVDANEYEAGEIVKISAQVPAKDGYVFAGWKMDYENNVYDVKAKFTMPACDVILTAQWVASTSEGDVFVVASKLVNGVYGDDYTASLTAKSTVDASKVEYPDIYFALVDEDGYGTGSDELGNGLTLNEDGTITGKPDTLGECAFRVVARNLDDENVSEIVDFTMTVNKAVLTAAYVDEEIYCGNEPALEISYTGWKFGEDEETADGFVAPVIENENEDPGLYQLIPSGGEADNYTFEYVAGNLHIIGVLNVEGKTLTVTKGKTVTEGKVAALAALTGIFNNDEVALTVEKYTINGVDYETAADAAAALTDLATAVGDYTVTITYTADLTGADADNYELADGAGTVDGVLRVEKGSSGGGGSSYSAPSTYAINVDSAKHGKVTVSEDSAAKGATITIKVKADEGYALGTLTVVDKNGKDVELTEKNSGKFTFTMPASKVTVSAAFRAEETAPQFFFEDVFATDYYYDAVLWAAENGITAGTDATHFTADALCNRAQAVTFLWRAAGCPVPNMSACPFVDVDMNSYYGQAVLWAVENGITKGTGETTFSPDAICSRGQIVTFLYRFAGGQAAGGASIFADVAVGDYCYDAVLWAVENSITNGVSADSFAPGADCTRGQIVTFLYRYIVK